MGENFETVKTGKSQEESTQAEIDALKEKNSQAKERTVNLSTIMYLAIYMLIFFSALCIQERQCDSIRSYLVFCVLILLCITTWAIYTDTDWILMVWGLRTTLIAIANFLIAKYKRVTLPQHWLSLPIILIVGVSAVVAELFLTVKSSSELAQWNSCAFGIFEISLLLISATTLANEKNPQFSMMSKLINMHVLMLPQPVWLLIRPIPIPFRLQLL